MKQVYSEIKTVTEAARTKEDQYALELNDPVTEGDSIVYSGQFVKGNGLTYPVYYKVPADFARYVSFRAEPFVLAFLFRAMEEKCDLVVHKPLRKSFLRNVAEFQAAWSQWLPHRYSKVNILAEAEDDEQISVREEKAVSALSGGVDGLYLLYHNKMDKSNRLPYNITASIFVHGFDIPLDKKKEFDKLYDSLNETCNEAGVELIPVETNIKQYGHWTDYHGIAIISCFYLFSESFNVALLGSSHTYDLLEYPYGSNPVTDAILSTNGFQIVHSGCAISRCEKVMGIAKWPSGSKNLRVCTKSKDCNCGKCEKCTRTMLNFKIIGVRQPPCFDRKLTKRQVRNIVAVNNSKLCELQSIYNYARDNGISTPWLKHLQFAIWKNKQKLRVRNFIYRKNNPHPLVKRLASIF